MNKLNILFLGDSVHPKDHNFFPQDILMDFLKKKIKHNIYFNQLDDKVYDAVFVFNTHRHGKTELKAIEGNVFAVMMENGMIFQPFMFRKLDQYDKVFSPIKQSENTIVTFPYYWWHVSLSYQKLKLLQPPTKTKKISCIMSNYRLTWGYTKRFYFRENFLKSSSLPIDFFGKNSHYILNKEDGLLDYKYSIAIENDSKPFYFTEKINDCFLCYTVPFYYGCKNIAKFFPEKSYIYIDIDRPKYAFDQIKDILKNDDYNSRIPFLQEARELVLEKNSIPALFKSLEPSIIDRVKTQQVKKYILEEVKMFFLKEIFLKKLLSLKMLFIIIFKFKIGKRNKFFE